MEADGLRWSLLVIGSLVIVGLAVHGIWLSRKNNENKTKTGKHKKDQEYQPSSWVPDTDEFDDAVNDINDGVDESSGMNFELDREEVTSKSTGTESKENAYDDLGLGVVRVVSDESKIDVEDRQAPSEDIKAEHTPAQPDVPTSKIYASVVTRPKPEYAAKYDSLVAATGSISKQKKATSSNAYRTHDHYQAPEPPPFLLKKQVSQPEGVSDQNDVDTEQNKINRRIEPKITEDKIHIDYDEPRSVTVEPSKKLDEGRSKAETTAPEQPQEVLVLNVKSADDNPILGSALLPMLLTLGFKFGEQDIFHRHINTNGKGPVLFSLANMFKPGNFDIDNLENFTTGGISLFMILPIEGEPHHVFNMMYNAARKIADEFSAQIYDDRRALLTKQSAQQYVERIREFERRRLLKS
jgi:cell division protein ZipA